MHSFETFAKIQKCSNLSPKLFKDSLHPNYNREKIFKAGEGAGRSGSFFFFSHDNRFIIKTMSSSELKLLLKILPDYAKHLENNPYSLIARIFGVFTVKVESLAPVTIMLMENTLQFR